MSNHYNYGISLDNGYNIYVQCGGTYYDRESGPMEGIMIQSPDMQRFDMGLEHFTKIALHHLREQGYLVLSPEERELLKAASK